MHSFVDMDLTIESHQFEELLAAGAFVLSASRSRSMDGGGNWSVQFKADDDGFFEQILQRYVRDDDWISLPFHNKTHRSPMLGLVSGIHHQERIDAKGGVTRSYTMNGRDWSKTLMIGQIRLGSILSTGTTKKIPTVASSYDPFTPWPDSGPLAPVGTFVQASGRPLRWTLFQGTGTVDSTSVDPNDRFQATISAALVAMGADKAHIIVTQAGEVYPLCDMDLLEKNIATGTGISDFDREAVSIAVVGAGRGTSYSLTAAQSNAIGEVCRWLSTQSCDVSRPSASWVDGLRWDVNGAVAPKYGCIGINEIYGIGASSTDPWDLSGWAALEAAIRPEVEVPDTVTLVDIPGVISDTKYMDVLSATVQGAYSGRGRADAVFRKLLEQILPGLYQDAAGADLLSRLSWRRFGPVQGMPWRLAQGIVGATITPHEILSQYGCAAYNELFYDYDGDEPAIVYRARPYTGSAWGALPIVDLSDGSAITGIDVSRSGDERFNFLRSSTVMTAFRGVDVTIDSASGRSPIIDTDSIHVHGLRIGDPQDDFMPPVNEQAQIIDYYQRRLNLFRRMYYHSPEMVTGSVTCVPAQPQIRLGTRVRLPIRYWFRGYETRQQVVGYVTQIDDWYQTGPNGEIMTGTTFLFVRGQPEGGLAVPAAKPWRAG
jgi:hypothetical protein